LLVPRSQFGSKRDESFILHNNLVKTKYNTSNNNTILDLERKINLAKGQERVDLVVKNAKIINVFSGEIHQADVVGMNDNDMLVAVQYISSIGGGLAVAENGHITAGLPLPIAGLISNQSIESVILNLTAVNQACSKLGGNVIKNPFMLLSFLSLPVTLSLKLTDKGLVDVDKFHFTSLWAD
jgi:adenine deaminase